MKKYLYCIIVLSTILASCSDDHKKRHEHAGEKGKGSEDTVTISAREQEGIKDIVNFYGGQCTHAVGKTPDAGLKYFEVRVSNSDAIENTKNMIGLSAANMACMVYQNVMAESQKKYDEIRVQITLKDGQKVSSGFPVASLAMVISKMRIVQMAVNLLKEKEYNGLASMINDKNGVENFDKKKLIEEIKKAEGSLGNIEVFVPYGYAFYRTDNGRSILRISGVLKRDKQNNEFSVIVDPQSNKDELMMINYKL